MFVKIEQKKVFLEILEQIQEQIKAGAWSAGDKLPSERVLSEELGVSRTAVREAIRALEIIGLVRCVQGEGNFLAEDLTRCLMQPLSMMFALSGTGVRQVQQLRHALEVETARLAAVERSEAELLQLEQIVNRMETSKDEQERAELDRQLHYRIAEAARSPMILSILYAASHLIENLIIGIRVSIMTYDSGFAMIDSQHRAILAAIRLKDAKLAARCMDEHMEQVESYLMHLEKANPNN